MHANSCGTKRLETNLNVTVSRNARKHAGSGKQGGVVILSQISQLGWQELNITETVPVHALPDQTGAGVSADATQ